jgi:hypothetical protein
MTSEIMITDPDPTLVMPTRRPPSAPTAMVTSGRIFGSGSAATPPRRERCRLMTSRSAYVDAANSSAKPMHILSSVSSSSAEPAIRWITQGPSRANGTEPTISHLASVQFGCPSLAWVIAPPVL